MRESFVSVVRCVAGIVVACLAMVGPAQAQERPNILWLSYEDSSPHLGCYGDPHAVTPNIDAFAKQAVRYTHVFTVAGVCAPSRSGIITGMYPTTIGSQHMRSQASLPDHIKTFPTYLRAAGYFTSPGWNTKHPRLQILTIKELLGGKQIDYPHVTGVTFKKAPRAGVESPEPEALPGLG